MEWMYAIFVHFQLTHLMVQIWEYFENNFWWKTWKRIFALFLHLSSLTNFFYILQGAFYIDCCLLVNTAAPVESLHKHNLHPPVTFPPFPDIIVTMSQLPSCCHSPSLVWEHVQSVCKMSVKLVMMNCTGVAVATVARVLRPGWHWWLLAPGHSGNTRPSLHCTCRLTFNHCQELNHQLYNEEEDQLSSNK